MKKENLLHTPEGVRDIYGSEFARKLSIEESIKKAFHSFGYEDIQTPSFEFFDVFSREIGTRPSKELYKFFDREGSTLVLRPDFTPSIARCAAKYFSDEEEPRRFCYQGNAFINISHLQGKLRETTHMGCELIGDGSVYADAENIALLIRTLITCGLTRFQVSLGQVEYFKGICQEAGISDEMELELREYISSKNYFGAEEFLIKNGVEESARGILLKSAELFGNVEVLSEARNAVTNERSIKAIERLEQIYEALKAYGVDRYVSFDLGMLSKYNYYTGLILRAYTLGTGEAVASGGRYDTLLGYFGKDRPAIGFMIVVDQLLEAISRQRIHVDVQPAPVVIEFNDSNFKEQAKEATRRRLAGENILMVKEGR